jgi:hypothetical protein
MKSLLRDAALAEASAVPGRQIETNRWGEDVLTA